MSEFSSEPLDPGTGSAMSMVDTWVSAFTRPNEDTYTRIAAQPSASATKAFLWIFVASILTTLASFIAQAASLGRQSMFQELLPPEIARELPIGTAPSIGVGAVICGVPVGAVFAVIGFAIASGLIHWAAKLFGGTGAFDKLVYTFSAITVPYSIIAAILVLLGIIPFVGILTGLISFALAIYVIVLEMLAVKAVHGLDTGKAVGAVLLPALAIFLLVCCCVIAVAAFFVPVIRESSFGLYQSLAVF